MVGSRRSVIVRIDEWLMRMWAKTPGIRRGGEGRVALCVLAYTPLVLVFVALLIVLPAVALVVAIGFAILTDGWGARAAIAGWLPARFRPKAMSSLREWLGFLVLLAAVGFPLAVLASLAYAFTPLAVLAWWIVWREKGSVASRILHAVVAVAFMPLALALWYLRRGNGWSRFAVVTGILLSLETYGILVALWLSDHTVFGDGALAALLLLSVSVVWLASAFVVSVAIRIADDFCEPAPAGKSQTTRQRATARPGVVSIGLLLPLRLALWALVQLAFLAPWIYAVQGQFADLGDRIFLYAFVGTAALPMAVTSLVAVLMGWHGRHRTASQAMEQHLGVALASSLLLALGVSVTFAVLTTDLKVRIMIFAWWFTGVTAGVAGLNIGLSLRLVKRNVIRRYWTYASSGVTAGLIFVAALVFMGAAASDTPFRSPNDTSHFLADFAYTASFPALAVFGLCAGLLISGLLYPSLQSFAGTMIGLREMVKPIVGFVCGYALIVLTFGAAYYGVYLASRDSFACQQPDGSTVSCASMQLGERDFMFLSVNTSLPLGYSPIKPIENRVQWLTVIELWLATAWVVVIFAAMLHHIQTQMVRKITADQMERIRRSTSLPAWPGPADAGPTIYDWPD